MAPTLLPKQPALRTEALCSLRSYFYGREQDPTPELPAAAVFFMSIKWILLLVKCMSKHNAVLQSQSVFS